MASSPSLPLKTNLKLSLLTLFLNAIRRRDGTLRLHRRLTSLFELAAGPIPTPVPGVRTADCSVDPARSLWFRLFLPADPSPAPLPVLVFFHGGGFAFLSPAKQEYDLLCKTFCKELSVAVISVNYRLSPEHRYPAQYEDGLSVIRFLDGIRHPSNGLLKEFFMSADLSRCFLAGDSAGANIAHNVARRWSEMGRRRVRLLGLVSIQPFFGGEARVPSEQRLPNGPIVTLERTDWMWKAFLPPGSTRDHVAACAAAAAENLREEFPPVLVIAGEFDPLLDWQRKYFWSLIRNGKKAELIEYPGKIHAFYVFPELGGVEEMMEDIRRFIVKPGGCEMEAKYVSVAAEWEKLVGNNQK